MNGSPRARLCLFILVMEHTTAKQKVRPCCPGRWFLKLACCPQMEWPRYLSCQVIFVILAGLKQPPDPVSFGSTPIGPEGPQAPSQELPALGFGGSSPSHSSHSQPNPTTSTSKHPKRWGEPDPNFIIFGPSEYWTDTNFFKPRATFKADALSSAPARVDQALCKSSAAGEGGQALTSTLQVGPS